MPSLSKKLRRDYAQFLIDYYELQEDPVQQRILESAKTFKNQHDMNQADSIRQAIKLRKDLFMDVWPNHNIETEKASEDDFRKMQSRYKNYQQIYTDGSKEDSKVGCAVISDNHSNMQRIPDDSSIFTAEAKAVDLALDFISTCDANNKFIIFSDSLSVLKAMNHTSSKNPQIQKL